MNTFEEVTLNPITISTTQNILLQTSENEKFPNFPVDGKKSDDIGQREKLVENQRNDFKLNRALSGKSFNPSRIKATEEPKRRQKESDFSKRRKEAGILRRKQLFESGAKRRKLLDSKRRKLIIRKTLNKIVETSTTEKTIYDENIEESFPSSTEKVATSSDKIKIDNMQKDDEFNDDNRKSINIGAAIDEISKFLEAHQEVKVCKQDLINTIASNRGY